MKQINWQAVAEQTREIFPNINQIVLYRGNRWLLNFEIEPDNYFNSFHPLTAVIRKHHLNAPLVMSHSFIQSSLDSYPLEFIDIKSDYTNLYVIEDIIATLQFKEADVRLEIERELRSKILLTKSNALLFKGNSRQLYYLLNESFNALIPVFKGFCYLGGKSIPTDVNKLLDALEEVLHTPVKVFRLIAAQTKAPSNTLIDNIFNDYIRMLVVCNETIDNWNK